MEFKQVARNRLGTPFQSPSWRYSALKNPLRFDLDCYCNKQENNSQWLVKLGNKEGLDWVCNRKFPTLFKKLRLNLEQERELNRLVKKKARSTGGDIIIKKQDNYRPPNGWNLKKVDNLKDVWLYRLVRYVYGGGADEPIAQALRLNQSVAYGLQMKRFMGYTMYAGLSDEEIAKKWKLQVKTIEAIRNLFYDFSALPEDKVAQWSVIVQMFNHGDLHPDEYDLYKRIFDMGYLGLKAQVAGFSLTDEEEQQLKHIVTKTAVLNVFNIHFGIKTTEDALAYSRVLQDTAKLQLGYELVKLKQKEQLKMDTELMKVQRELALDTSDRTLPEDMQLLQSAVHELALVETNPEFESFLNLNKG